MSWLGTEGAVSDATVSRAAVRRVGDVRRRLRELVTRAVALGFGGRVGLVLYLGCLVVFGLVLQLGVFINDNYTLANAVVNLADGRLAVETVVYGPTDTATPGMIDVDGETYGRIYGAVAAGVVVYWVLAAVAAVADVGIVLTGVWSLLLYLVVWLGSDVLGRSRDGMVVGSLLAGGLFVANSYYASEIAAKWLPLLGLQLATMLAAGFVCVFLYRLLEQMYDTQVGVAAGLTATFGTPVVFWSSIPKRHAFALALAVGAMYAFYRSRAAETASARLRHRALAYVPAGLAGWLQLSEAALLVVPLAVVDLATAKENGVRELGTVAAVGVLSCVPLFVTNFVISGSPLQSPLLYRLSIRLDTLQVWPAVEGIGVFGGESGTTGGESGVSGGSSGGVSIGSLVGRVTGALSVVVEPFAVFGSIVLSGVGQLLDPEKFITVFIRGGYIESIANRDSENIRLAVLEAAPLLAVLAAAPIQIGRWLGNRRRVTPQVATDLFVAAYVVLYTLAYGWRLPIHASVTARYLMPLYPALVYAMFRLPVVRRTLSEWRLLVGTAVGTAVVGLELYVLAILAFEYRIGEAAQLLALGALVVAGPLAGWSVWASLDDTPSAVDDQRRWKLGAVVAGLAIGWGAMSMLAFRLFLLPYGETVVLPVVHRLLEFVPLF